MPWTDTTSPFDAGAASGGCWASDLEEFVAVGTDDALTAAIAKSADGQTWTYEASPFDGGQGLAVTRDLFHSLYVAVGVGGSDTILTSPDGVTWTGRGNPFSGGDEASCVACKQATGGVVVGAYLSAGGQALAFAADPTASFTTVASPFDDGDVASVDYSPSEDRWIAGGSDAAGTSALVAYSDDDGATWTLITTHPMTIDNGYFPYVYRDEDAGKWWLLGQTTGGFAVAVSDDNGATWTEISTPLDPSSGLGYADAMCNVAGTYALTGQDASGTNQVAGSRDGTDWALDLTPSPFGTGWGNAIAYGPAANVAVVLGRGEA